MNTLANTISTSPSIYVACLSAYNSGFLHGKWIDAAQDAENVLGEIKEMLKASPVSDAEEWAIHDYEGFGNHNVEEWSDINELCELAKLLDEEDGELILELIDHMGSGTSIDDARDYFSDNYQGCHKDLGSWAYDFYHECYDMNSIPESLMCHIDWDQVGKTAEMNGDIFTIEMNDGCHVFNNAEI